jgi:hypothetical protein
MPEATAPAVNHDADLVFSVDPHLARGRLVKNLLHHLTSKQRGARQCFFTEKKNVSRGG